MFFQLFSYFFSSSIITLLDNYFFPTPSKGQSVKRWLSYTLGIQLSALTILRFCFKIPNVLVSHLYNQNFLFKYIAFAIMIGIFWLILKGLAYQLITIKTSDKTKLTKKEKVIFIISAIGMMLAIVFFLGSNWFISAFGRLTPEQFIFNFKSPVNGTATGMIEQIISTPVLLGCLIFFFYCAFYLTKITFLYKDKALFNRKHRQRFLSIVALGSLIFSSIYAIKELRLTEVYTAYFDQSTFIQKEYVKPQAVNLQFPRQKKNLIHIYLESIENSYFDQANGGYMKENLMPDLMNLAKEGIHFSSNNKFGGPIQTYGSSWSVAAMVNMSSGLPLKIPMDGNSYGKTGQFLPGAVMIGDILQEQGYNQTIMFGADADFGGLTSFFKTHGNYHIFDVKYARKAGLIPSNYNVWWGFEDNKLYEFTKQELTRLASLNQPFNFTMENADTHFPDGFVEPDMPKLYTSQYANVIHYSQKQVVDLVRWIQQQPFYKDTVIVLTGDHPSMDKKFFENFDPNYQRTTFNLILNADFPNQTFSTKNRQYAPYDYFPTILASMGVKIKDERLGLGVNLASSQPTLIEKYGLKKVNQELSKNSRYYNNEFVDEKWAKK